MKTFHQITSHGWVHREFSFLSKFLGVPFSSPWVNQAIALTVVNQKASPQPLSLPQLGHKLSHGWNRRMSAERRGWWSQSWALSNLTKTRKNCSWLILREIPRQLIWFYSPRPKTYSSQDITFENHLGTFVSTPRHFGWKGCEGPAPETRQNPPKGREARWSLHASSNSGSGGVRARSGAASQGVSFGMNYAPQKIHWVPNHWYPWIWCYLERESWQMYSR